MARRDARRPQTDGARGAAAWLAPVDGWREGSCAVVRAGG